MKKRLSVFSSFSPDGAGDNFWGIRHNEDYDLVSQARRGKEAYRKLVVKYQERVYATIFQILHHRADAEDITQETFIKAYYALDKFDPKYKFSTWLLRIAINTTLSFIKKRQRKPVTIPLAEELIIPDQEVDIPKQSISLERLRKAVDSLRPNYRVPFVLFHIEKFSYDEIAEIMNVSLGSVKNYLFRARKWLKKRLLTELAAST